MASSETWIKVMDLRPGDRIDMPAVGMSAVFIAQCPHPVWSHLQLVVWRLSNGEMSLDALAAGQVVQGVLDRTVNPVERIERIKRAIGIGG